VAGLGFSKPKNPGGVPYGPYERRLDPNYQDRNSDYAGNSADGQDYPDGTYNRRREIFWEGFARDSEGEWEQRPQQPDDAVEEDGRDEAWRRQWRKRWKQKAREAGLSEEDADGMLQQWEEYY